MEYIFCITADDIVIVKTKNNDIASLCPYLGNTPQSVFHQNVCQFLCYHQHHLCIILIFYLESVLNR